MLNLNTISSNFHSNFSADLIKKIRDTNEPGINRHKCIIFYLLQHFLDKLPIQDHGSMNWKQGERGSFTVGFCV